MKCPQCNGEGLIFGMFPKYADDFKGERKPYIELPCSICNATGEYNGAYDKERGEKLRYKRLHIIGMALREFCIKMDLRNEISDIGKLERGFMINDDLLHRYEEILQKY